MSVIFYDILKGRRSSHRGVGRVHSLLPSPRSPCLSHGNETFSEKNGSHVSKQNFRIFEQFNVEKHNKRSHSTKGEIVVETAIDDNQY